MARDWEGEVRALIERLAAAEGLPTDALVGATDEQIDALARIQGFDTLPEPYVVFLRLVGGEVTDPYLFVGETIVVPHLIADGGPSWRVEHVTPDGPRFFGIRPVFLDHEGWEFRYFIENRDDSPIAYTGEGATGEGPVVAPDFVAWLEFHTEAVEHNARNRPPPDPRLEAMLPIDGSTKEGVEALAGMSFDLLEAHMPGAIGADRESFVEKSATLFDQFAPTWEESERQYRERRRRLADQATAATADAIAALPAADRASVEGFERTIQAAVEELADDEDVDLGAMAAAATQTALASARAARDKWETTYRIWTAASRANRS